MTRGESKANREKLLSDLAAATMSVVSNPSDATESEFSSVIHACMVADPWVYVCGKQTEQGFMIRADQQRGRNFLRMIIGSPQGRLTDTDMMATSFRKLIQFAFNSPGYAGIIIDPPSACIEDHILISSILHGHHQFEKCTPPPRRNWGRGIPKYTDADLMTPWELQSFAIETLPAYEDSIKSYEMLSLCDNPSVVPSLVFIKDDRFHLVHVKACIAPNKPELTERERHALRTLASIFNADCMWAGFSFGASDPDRFAAGLALKGDGFYCKYTGLNSVE